MAKSAAFDWTQFQSGIYIKARPDDLFRLWSTGHGLCRWFLRSAEFAGSDGPPARKSTKSPPYPADKARGEDEACCAKDMYRWEWYYDGGISGDGWILQVRPPNYLRFTFGHEMEVEVTIRKHGAWCEVNLRQYKIPDTPHGRWNLHMGSRVGWTFFLTNLKSVSERGPDLRETERPRTKQLHLANI